MSASELEALRADIFVMSPPCQPFTRQGLKGDSSDHRTDSFFHLMSLLPQMERKPKYLFLENVKGFEESKTRGQFVEVLERCGMEYREFLLSPAQFGIPNSRLRYYLCAKLKSESGFVIPPSPTWKPITDLTDVLDSALLMKETLVQSTTHQPYTETKPSHKDVCHSAECSPLLLSHFCQNLSEKEAETYLLPLKTVAKYISAMDVVTMADNHSCCFTKAYGHYIVGTGSILQQNMEASLETCYSEYQKVLKEARMLKHAHSKVSPGEARTDSLLLLPCCSLEDGRKSISDSTSYIPESREDTLVMGEGMLNEQEDIPYSKEEDSSLLQDDGVMHKAAASLAPLQLRYFTEREIANLHCYPQDFTFPADLSFRQRCKAMGNGLNVKVVATLMKLFLFDNI